jgi:hypothetical protein
MGNNTVGAIGGTDGGSITMLYQSIHTGEGLEIEERSHFPGNFLG